MRKYEIFHKETKEEQTLINCFIEYKEEETDISFYHWIMADVSPYEIIFPPREIEAQRIYDYCRKNIVEEVQESVLNEMLDRVPTKGKKTRKRIRKSEEYKQLVQKRIDAHPLLIAVQNPNSKEYEQQKTRIQQNDITAAKNRFIHDCEHAAEKYREKIREEVLNSIDLSQILGTNFVDETIDYVMDTFAEDKVLFYYREYDNTHWHNEWLSSCEVCSDEFYELIDDEYALDEVIPETIFMLLCGYEWDASDYIIKQLLEADSRIATLYNEDEEFEYDLNEMVIESELNQEMIDAVHYLDPDTVIDTLRSNPNYPELNEHFEQKERERKEEERIKRVLGEAILDRIPDNVIELYPNARNMQRKFYLHIGPTNSGKTYDAVEALKKANNGAYLAPLRLLAYEQYEALNAAGIPCSLITGEERIEKTDARHVSSTVEMADLQHHYDVVVIDEAQMITDPSRGGAWTTAILGICADELHVCGSPDLVAIIRNIVNDCGDELEIIEHFRSVPLIMEDTPFTLDDVRKGDALIVFSRKSVYGLAAEMSKRGYKCSIVYGALPYVARTNEAKRFADGKTDILIATDAIGMGMNLPIERIVFMETRKYDGYSMRELETNEYQQIAGRAGRQGIYETGYVNVAGDAKQRKKIGKALTSKLSPIKKAGLSFPSSLLGIDAPLSKILERWKETEIAAPYAKEDVDNKIMLAEILEARSNNKPLIAKFVNVAFNSKEQYLMTLWLEMFEYADSEQQEPLTGFLPFSSDDIRHFKYDDMETLERCHRICDLIYAVGDTLGWTDGKEEIVEARNGISQKIMKLMEQNAPKGKRCRYCGRELPWDFHYAICEDCYSNRYW